MLQPTTKLALPKITNKQKQILFYIYQFRFINTRQLQLIFNHKNPKKIQLWLKDLKDKKYIKRHEYKDSFLNRSKPAVYYLGNVGRRFLKMDKNCDIDALNKMYKENKRKESTITFHLTLVDIYINFLRQMKENEELGFYTESQLLKYTHFPNPLPSAFISIKNSEKTKRYFLEVFKEYANSKILRSKVKAYIQYVEEGHWDEFAKGKPFPIVLFVCLNENLKKHVAYFAKALFEKEYEEKFQLYVASKTRMLQNGGTLMWEKVKI